MARPQTPRRIRKGLRSRVFKPRAIRMDKLKQVELTLDGLEALRLVDLEGLYQVGAAERMGVSRATLSRVLAEARKVVAEALVKGKAIVIEGGVVERRSTEAWPCPVHGRKERQGRGCHCGSE